MELTLEEVAQLIGVKELENYQLRKRIAELEGQPEPSFPEGPPETI
jgi:hypothetical protein